MRQALQKPDDHAYQFSLPPTLILRCSEKTVLVTWPNARRRGCVRGGEHRVIQGILPFGAQSEGHVLLVVA